MNIIKKNKESAAIRRLKGENTKVKDRYEKKLSTLQDKYDSLHKFVNKLKKILRRNKIPIPEYNYISSSKKIKK